MGESFRMLRRPPAGNDSKSQNSDYGSFCNTPNCDNNAAAPAPHPAQFHQPASSHVWQDPLLQLLASAFFMAGWAVLLAFDLAASFIATDVGRAPLRRTP